MKSLSLHQPWASLIACGAKTIETRDWQTDYRGPLAIHATKQKASVSMIPGAAIGMFSLYCQADAERLLDTRERPPMTDRWVELPLGAVVATCRLVDCVRTERIKWEPTRFTIKGRLVEWSMTAMEGESVDARVAESERPYGDFAPGRFAWLLADVEPVAPPVPARGRQRLWNWEQP